jgi:hypothetical protein
VRVGVHYEVSLDAIAAGILRICEHCGAVRMSVSGGCDCKKEGEHDGQQRDS